VVLRAAVLCSGNGGVAQLGERLLCKQEVDGSSPFTSTGQKSEARNQISEISGMAGNCHSDICFLERGSGSEFSGRRVLDAGI
jgi:hypothetical protein